MTWVKKLKKRNKNLMKRIQQEKLIIKQEQILREKQRSAQIKEAIKNNKSYLNKTKLKQLKTAFFNTLAFTKEDEFIGKAIVNRKRSLNQFSNTVSNRDFAMTINKKKEKLNRILTKAEKVTKNLFLEEQRNKKLEDMLNE